MNMQELSDAMVRAMERAAYSGECAEFWSTWARMSGYLATVHYRRMVRHRNEALRIRAKMRRVSAV